MKPLIRLGWLYFLLLLLLGLCEPAHAATGYRLVLYFYTTADGHGLPLGTYVGSLPENTYPTRAACDSDASKRTNDYKAGVIPGGAMLLVWAQCEGVKP